ncbi:MAG: hypothetical protein RLZZ612_422 [Pseudomonadota bacterium]
MADQSSIKAKTTQESDKTTVSIEVKSGPVTGKEQVIVKNDGTVINKTDIDVQTPIAGGLNLGASVQQSTNAITGATSTSGTIEANKKFGGDSLNAKVGGAATYTDSENLQRSILRSRLRKPMSQLLLKLQSLRLWAVMSSKREAMRSHLVAAVLKSKNMETVKKFSVPRQVTPPSLANP